MGEVRVARTNGRARVRTSNKKKKDKEIGILGYLI